MLVAKLVSMLQSNKSIKRIWFNRLDFGQINSNDITAERKEIYEPGVLHCTVKCEEKTLIFDFFDKTINSTPLLQNIQSVNCDNVCEVYVRLSDVQYLTHKIYETEAITDTSGENLFLFYSD